MAALIDSNIMVRWANLADPERQLTLTALSTLRHQGEILHSMPQNYIEFWSVATRPVAVNGLGISSNQAAKLINRLQVLFPILPDSSDIFEDWLKLVLTEQVAGKQVHDARLVAVMIAHGVPKVITFNAKDFTRYSRYGITVIHPAAL